LDSIDELIDNRLWKEGAEGEFYFSHSMIKQIVYEDRPMDREEELSFTGCRYTCKRVPA